MKTIFMGSDGIAIELLEVLRRRSRELLVVSQPDRPTGRGQKTRPGEISAWAVEKDIPLLRPERLDETFLTAVRGFAPDLMFVMAYGKLLKEPLIALPRLGTWNLHASLLPRLRGASPIETAIASGETQTAIALMKMVLALDAGPVGPVMKIPLLSKTTTPDLRGLIARASADLVEAHWPELETGTLPTEPQDEAEATYCRPLKKEDSFLDPAASAVELARRVRAFAEKPGSAFVFAGERLKVFETVALEGKPDKPAGAVLEAGERLVIATGKGLLEIKELQRAGGKRMSAREFLRGYPMKAGDAFFGRPLRALVAKKPFPRGY